MKIDNIDNIANKEKSPDKAERSASIDEIKKTQKFFDFNDLSNAATINNKNLIIPEKDALFDYISPGSSKLKKLLLNSDPEVANLNINNEKVHNNSEYLNINNNNNNNNNNINNSGGGSSTLNNNSNVLPLDSSNSSNATTTTTTKINNNNSLLKPKLESNNNVVSANSNKIELKKSARNLNKQKLFWCSECNEYFLKLNLFNHMKSVHNKFTCMYCYGFFVKIGSLENHLVKKHKVQNTSFFDEQALRNYFDVKDESEEAVSKVVKAVCCKCGSIFIVTDNNFTSHCCVNDSSSSIIKEPVQNDIPNKTTNNNNNNSNVTYLAVHENEGSNCVDSLITTSSVNQLNSAKDDLYCEKAIQQWLQPNIKSTINGATENSNEASSQKSVPLEYEDNNSKSEKSPWHDEEQKQSQPSNENVPMKLTVPKLTLKIPKAFQNQTFDNIDSDEDSGDEEEDEESVVSENCELDKSKSMDNSKNKSNSLNDFSSSLSDSDNEDSESRTKQDETASSEIPQPEPQQKRPENLPCLKLKIKNLTSNPESVLESFDYSSITAFKPESENLINDRDLNDVDMSECPMDIEPSIDASENSSSFEQQKEILPPPPEIEAEPEPKKIIIDGNVILPANEDILPIDIRLDESLDKIPILKLMKICLNASFQFCLYCNHARKIVVNGKGLGIHFITHHRFHALVDSITAEELHPEKFVSKFETSIEELSTCYFNLDTYDDHDEEKKEGHVTISHDKLYECFQCRFQTPIHKELYLHNRKMHQKSLINCLMCKMGFYSYSELLCHICPGVANKQTFNDYKFYCCLCNMDNIPSAFRLMVHLRKKHYACDVCLEKCSDQSKLSSHVWKHKLLHICYRCHIFYQNKADIMKHLFWKHGTEGVECKKCLQKKWPHVYHFCIPPATFTCPHCEMQFSRAMSLKVHVRLHEDGAKYACTEIGCDKKFISKKLLIRHLERHQSELAAQENGNQDRTEATVIIPHEIPDGCCTRTIPVVFKRFIKKPPVRKIETEPKIEAPKVETEPTTTATKKEEEKEPKTLPDLPETQLNLSESSDTENSSSDEGDTSNKAHKNAVPDTLNKINKIADTKNKATKEEVKKGSDEKMQTKSIERDLVEKKHDSIAQLNKVSTLSDSDDDEDEQQQENGSNKTLLKQEDLKTENSDQQQQQGEPMKNILENLKNFQESQQDNKDESLLITKASEVKTESLKNDEESNEIEDKLPDKISLHVCMSDHDYAKLYQPPAGTTTDDLEEVIKSATIDKDKSNKKSHDKNEKSKVSPSKKKGEKSLKKSDDFSSSSSGSDSSSNSSSSSSGSSSSSSTASTSDSSSSEASSTNTNRQRNKKFTKKRSKKDKKVDEQEEVEIPRDPDDIIYESDLLTDGTDTDDEDFYDEHPLKVNNEVLAEKRKQLGDIDGIIENSRPSTPSLPPDEKVEKRMKVKKRKRDHKKSISSPTKRSQREQNSVINADDESTSFSTTYYSQHHSQSNAKNNLPETPQNFKNSKFNHGFMHTSTPISAPPRIELHQANQIRQLLQSTQQQPVLPILKEQHYHHQHQSQSLVQNQANNNEYISVSRVSSAQSSRMNSDNEQSGIKRSQRRRIPNKFYGYTSDDDKMMQSSQLPTNDPFKPIPPPNLTWNKEDLPSRSKSPTQQQQQRVAPIKLNLNSNDHLQQPPQIYEDYEASISQQAQLPISNKISNNLQHQSNNNKNETSASAYHYSDSESTDGQLHISEPKTRKRKLPSQNMYAFHTLETPPTVQPNQPPIPRLKLTIGSNNKIRRRNINPLKPPPKKRRKANTAPLKSAANSSTNNFSMTLNASLTANSFSKLYENNTSSFDQTDSKPNNQLLAHEKKQKLEEAIMNTQQYFQRYNHTQVSNADVQVSQEQTDNNDGRVYCYCRRPYDDLQGMIGCDGPQCQIEWFHFECVGILVPPKGNWFCPECQKQHQTF